MKKAGVMYGILAGITAIGTVAAEWTFTDTLNYAASMGVFKYVLPFLLIFAIVYGLLSKTKILGDNNGVNAIIALALGLLALVGDYVPNFFEKIMPNVGMALAIILAAVVLLGLFFSEEEGKGIKWIKYVIFGVGAIAFLAVVSNSFSGQPGYWDWQRYGPALITLLVIAGVIALIAWGGKGNDDGKKTLKSTKKEGES